MERTLTKPTGWHDARRKGLGGSDIAAVIGLSKWAGPMDVWSQKHGLTPPLDETNAMRRGRIFESAIANWYAEETGFEVLDGNEMPIKGPKPFMLASPDGYVSAPGGPFGLEIKTARSVDGWGESGSAGVPVYYATQAVWYMACTNIDRWDFAVFFLMNDEFRRYTLIRNKDTENKLVKTCSEWWERHVVIGDPPPVDGTDASAKYLQDKFKEAGKEYRAPTRDEEDLIFDLGEVKDKMKDLKEKEATLKNKLKERIGDDAGLQGVFGTVSWKMNKGRSTIDTKLLKKNHPEIAEELTKTSEPSRVFRMNIQHKRGN